MKTVERTGAPALGNAFGYFAALYLIDKVEWLTPDNESLAVAMMGVVFIHVLAEARNFTSWIISKYNQASQ